MKNIKYSNIGKLLEYSEFNQYQLGIDTYNPFGPDYGFATDPGLSIYGTDQDSPYTSVYNRNSGSINRLSTIANSALNDIEQRISMSKQDAFIDDVDLYSDYKILRIFKNESNHLNIYISFNFDGEEFFGVYKNYNWYSKSQLQTELYNDMRYQYMDKEYRLKLSNYIINILDNWFRPTKGLYKNLKDKCIVKDEMGNIVYLKKNSIIDVKGVDIEKDGQPYIILKQKNKKYFVYGNDYYFFNYWFELIKN